MTTRILFVCLGNICRSPLAESIFKDMAAQAGRGDEFEVDSAGTYDGHVGHPADRRTRAVAAAHGLTLDHTVRQVAQADFDTFDLILAMDFENKADLLSFSALTPEQKAKVKLFREYDPQARGSFDMNVPDPYYGASNGFELVYAMLERTAKGLLASLSPQS
nr:low molecular weight phosphotyrosine protein phosphatase [Chloroflexota bacterium]